MKFLENSRVFPCSLPTKRFRILKSWQTSISASEQNKTLSYNFEVLNDSVGLTLYPTANKNNFHFRLTDFKWVTNIKPQISGLWRREMFGRVCVWPLISIFPGSMDNGWWSTNTTPQLATFSIEKAFSFHHSIITEICPLMDLNLLSCWCCRCCCRQLNAAAAD